MTPHIAATILAALIGLSPGAQNGPEPHLAAAKTAAGAEFQGLYGATCGREFPTAPSASASATTAARTAGPPARETWYAAPQKVFDDLYWVGTKEHSAWALATSEGIILIDTLYAYAVEPEIVDGLKALGLDPAQVKYVIVSHGHGDHDQGAALFQSRYGSRIVMGAADWEGVTRNPNRPGGAPRRDIGVGAVEKITLGGKTVTVVPTPGHTPGTLSLLFPVRDGGRTLTVAYSGGTAFNFTHTAERFDTYVASQQAMARAAAEARATIILSNHSAFDHAAAKAPLALQARRPGQPHVFELGAGGVARYFKVLEECAVAARKKEFGR